MSVKEIYTTLYDFLVDWLTDRDLREHYKDDMEAALHDNGFYDVDPKDILACLPLVAEDLPPVYQEAIYTELNALSETNSGSYFEVNQGGGSYDAVQGGGEGGGTEAASGGGEGAMETVVKHIQNITENNYSWIDDSGDVSTTVTALGDVDFEQIVASGAGAVAADGDVEGVNTGINYGVVAGGDAEGVEVTSVFGDGNVTGDFGDDAAVVTGDDNVLAKDSTVIDGDFDGGFIGGDVAANQSALNFGDGDVGQDNSVDNSVHIDDSYNTDNSVDAKDSFNTDNSVNDSGNTTVKDSFQDNDKYKYTDNSDNSVNDSGNTSVKDSFQDNDSWSYEEENHSYTKTVTKTETEIDIDAEYNSDDDGKDIDITE